MFDLKEQNHKVFRTGKSVNIVNTLTKINIFIDSCIANFINTAVVV